MVLGARPRCAAMGIMSTETIEVEQDEAQDDEIESTTFEQLGLSEELLKAVRDAGYTTPTPIQAEAIPLVLKGRDVMGLAQTGTGKTAAFTLPIVDRLLGGPQRTRALVLTPTRELCVQVEESVQKYATHAPISRRVGLRRRAARSAAEEAARRSRHRRRDAGPADRSPRAPERRVRRPRGARARRSGPHARHGLRAADQPHRRRRPELPANAALQRDDAARSRSARPQVSAQAGRRAGGTPVIGREHRDARRVSGAARPKERAARAVASR